LCPFLAGLPSYGDDGSGRWLCAGDLPHGVVERKAKHLDVEVDGVAGEVAFGPAPIAVFDDETGTGGQNEVVRLPCDDFESAFFE